MSVLIDRLYNSQSIQQWQHKRTMLHSSGIWGREPVLEYLADQVIKSGDVVVDVGAGAGFPTLRMATMAGPAGNVVGIELSEAMIEAARQSVFPTRRHLARDAAARWIRGRSHRLRGAA